MLLLCIAGEVLPAVDDVMSMDLAKILPHPLVFFGAADLVLATLLGLGGLYCSTIFVSYLPVFVCAGLGLAGLGSVAWHLLS